MMTSPPVPLVVPAGEASVHAASMLVHYAIVVPNIYAAVALHFSARPYIKKTLVWAIRMTTVRKCALDSFISAAREPEEVEAMLMQVQRKKKRSVKLEDNDPIISVEPQRHIIHHRTDFGNKGRPLYMPTPTSETGHTGEPCGAHERIVTVERYGRTYKRKMPDSKCINVRTDAPPGSTWCV